MADDLSLEALDREIARKRAAALAHPSVLRRDGRLRFVAQLLLAFAAGMIAMSLMIAVAGR